jgi:type IV fimbrial biogenesis protein FimT
VKNAAPEGAAFFFCAPTCMPFVVPQLPPVGAIRVPRAICAVFHKSQEQPSIASPRMKSRSTESGFTMVELLATIAVVAVLAAIAVPAFRSSIAGSRLTSTTNNFIGALNQARSEAVRRNATVQFCGSTAAANGADALGTECATNVGNVYVLDPGTGIPVKVVDGGAIPPHITASNGGNAVPALRYNGQGLAHALASSAPFSGLVADVSSDQLTSNNHRCIYILTGSAISSCPSSGSCPASEPSNCQ